MKPVQDSRNVQDEFKGLTEDAITQVLDVRGVELEIAIENLERDFNMGSIVRTANAFGVRHVHVVGRRQWNKRGAMATDKYLHVHYHQSVEEFAAFAKNNNRQIIVVDNIEGAGDLQQSSLPARCLLVFGSEGTGVSNEMIKLSEVTVAIRQVGSTRSMNVAAAAAIAMYEWVRQHPA